MIVALIRIIFAVCVMAVIFVAWSLATNTQALSGKPGRGGARPLNAGAQ